MAQDLLLFVDSRLQAFVDGREVQPRQESVPGSKQQNREKTLQCWRLGASLTPALDCENQAGVRKLSYAAEIIAIRWQCELTCSVAFHWLFSRSPRRAFSHQCVNSDPTIHGLKELGHALFRNCHTLASLNTINQE